MIEKLEDNGTIYQREIEERITYFYSVNPKRIVATVNHPILSIMGDNTYIEAEVYLSNSGALKSEEALQIGKIISIASIYCYKMNKQYKFEGKKLICV